MSFFNKINISRINYVLGLIILQLSLQTLGQQCGQTEYHLLNEQQLLNISSPNYPRAYASGSRCSYRIIAPLDHIVLVNCQYELYPNGCTGTEFFQISRDGDFDYRDGEAWCRTTTVRSNSHFRVLVLGYQSRGQQQRGRFFCQAVARRQPCDCGWTRPTKITNGQEVTMHEYPSMVALRDITSSQRIFCGGNIITHRIILTAAHCIQTQPDARRIMAYVGDHDLSSSTESRFAVQHAIQRIITHPGYNSATVANDLALLITVRNIEWSRGVAPICLPFRHAAESFAYVNVDVIGWGTLSFAGSKSNTLQKVQLLTMDNRACQQQYNNSLLPTQICTYDYRGLGQDSCQYDSGGPVIFRQQRMFLLGVISFGRTCGTRYAIGVNTRITSHLNWIYSYVGGGACIV